MFLDGNSRDWVLERSKIASSRCQGGTLLREIPGDPEHKNTMYSPTTVKTAIVIDPQRDGIANALWHVVTPDLAVSGGKFRFNAAEGLVVGDLKFGRFEFKVNFPLTGVQTPANLNNDIEFGLKNLSLGTIGKISVLADQSAGTFIFTTYDVKGSSPQVTTIPWNTAWNGVDVRFVIEWFNDRVALCAYVVSGTALEVLAQHKTSVGQYPLNVFVSATGNDNFDVSYIVLDNVMQNSFILVGES